MDLAYVTKCQVFKGVQAPKDADRCLTPFELWPRMPRTSARLCAHHQWPYCAGIGRIRVSRLLRYWQKHCLHGRREISQVGVCVMHHRQRCRETSFSQTKQMGQDP